MGRAKRNPSADPAKRWVSQKLNPSYGLASQGLGEATKHVAYLDDLKNRHKAKRNFMKLWPQMARDERRQMYYSAAARSGRRPVWM
jgi:hypothetical protein